MRRGIRKKMLDKFLESDEALNKGVEGMREFLGRFDGKRTIDSISDDEIKEYIREQMSKVRGLF